MSPQPATRSTTLFSISAVLTYLQSATMVGGGVVDTRDSPRIVQIADAVSARIESQTKRVFVTRAFTETRNGTGTRSLRLHQFPVTALTSLAVTDVPGGTTTTLALGTDFDLNPVMGELRLRQGVFTRGFQNIAIAYSAGFDAQDGPLIPPDLYQAGLDYVKYILDRVASGAVLASSIRVGPSDVVVLPGIPKDIQAVIDSWTLVLV